MAAAQDEAYEMNVMRSATNDTAGVVEGSYRPLASSDDMHLGAGSRSDAVGSPNPISSSPRNDGTTDDQDFNNSMLYKQSAGRKHGTALERFAATCRLQALDSWLYECAALAFSVGCLVALAVMLGINDGKETPQLPYDITLNALISVLSTAAKSSLLFAIAGTLGQVKWAWFMERRELSDMQTFDDATRGPWGALILLCSRSRRPLASLGAAITILALTYDTFLQQLVRYPVIYESVWSDYATTKKGTSLNATGNFTDWDSARVAAWLEIGQFDRDPGCPTGNCTWPEFKSLEYCSKCGDTTADTSVECSAVFDNWDAKSNETCEIHPDQGYPATVWQSIFTDTTNYSYSKLDSIIWVVRQTYDFGLNDALYEPFVTLDPVPKSAFQSVTGAQYSYLGVENPMLVLAYASFEGDAYLDLDRDYPLNGSSAPVLAKAETCIITPCERTYRLSMIAGQLQTVVLDTDYGVSEIVRRPIGTASSAGSNITLIQSELCWRTTSYRRGNDAPVDECSRGDSYQEHSNPAMTACHEHGGDSNSGSSFCTIDNPSTGARRIGLLGRTGITATWQDDFWRWETEYLAEKLDVMTMGFPTRGMPTSQAVQAHNFSYLVERMAASMTKAELDNSTALVYGNVTTSTVHVEVAWYWFIPPAALNVLAILLLLATAIFSHHHKTRLWKSSTLALLYHGLDNPEPAPDLTMARISEMDRWASRTSAKLGSAKDGGRVVLRTLPRDEPPRD
jgi:hypothetical protein